MPKPSVFFTSSEKYCDSPGGTAVSENFAEFPTGGMTGTAWSEAAADFEEESKIVPVSDEGIRGKHTEISRRKNTVPRLLVLGNLGRTEFRIWWNSLPEAVRWRAFCVGDLENWLKRETLSEELRQENASGIASESAFGSASESASESASRSDFGSDFGKTDANFAERQIFPADFVVLLRSWSGEFTQSQVSELKKYFPLTPILAVLGSWCEGEARNGFPLAGVHSIYWYDFTASAPLEFAFIQNGWSSVWSFPPSDQPEFRALFEQKRLESAHRLWEAPFRGLAGEPQSVCVSDSVGASNSVCVSRPNGVSSLAEDSSSAGVSASAGISSSVEVSSSVGVSSSAEVSSSAGVSALNSVSEPVRICIESDDFEQFCFLRDLCQRFLGPNVWDGKPVQVWSSWTRGFGFSRTADWAGASAASNPAGTAESVSSSAPAGSLSEFAVGDEVEPHIILWDFPDLGTETRRKFEESRKRFPNAFFASFTEFPRAEEWQFLRRIGVSAIFPKPFRIDDLAFALSREQASFPWKDSGD